jgi:hypothetical protein
MSGVIHPFHEYALMPCVGTASPLQISLCSLFISSILDTDENFLIGSVIPVMLYRVALLHCILLLIVTQFSICNADWLQHYVIPAVLPTVCCLQS